MDAPSIVQAASEGHRVPGHDLWMTHIRGDSIEAVCLVGVEVAAGEYLRLSSNNYCWYFGGHCVLFDVDAENLSRR